MQNISKILIFIGLILIITGAIIAWGSDKFRWLGHLPGDIHIKKPSFSFYAPITTMIFLSLLISLLIWIIKKLM